MREKIYRAFTSDIEGVGFPGVDCLKDRLAAIKTDAPDEKDALASYDDAFLARMTYESNAIEGSTLSLAETALALEGEFTPSDDARLRDYFAARGCADGIAFSDKALDNGVSIDETFIKDVHERCALDLQPRVRGVYRRSAAFIRGSNTQPADPSRIYEDMASLMCAHEASEAHPIAKAAAFHAMFENIHPFADGNGRTGRLIMNHMLQEAGYPPIAIKNRTRVAYLEALEDWQVRENPEAFLSLVGSNVEQELRARIEAVEKTHEALQRDAERAMRDV